MIPRRRLLLALFLALIVAHVSVRRNKRRARSLAFWVNALPIVFAYKVLEWRCKTSIPMLRITCTQEREARWAALHKKYAPRVLQIIQELRGIFIKVGQVVSAQQDNFPEAYTSIMQQLQDSAPAEPIDVVQKTIEDGLGLDPQQVLSHLEPQALGAASIGQVHRARLVDDNDWTIGDGDDQEGMDVVVKVQHRDSAYLMEMDLDNVHALTRLANPNLMSICEEARKQFMLEFDFRREAWALETIGNNLRKFNRVVVPRPVRHLVCQTVLVMEELHGVKLSDPRAARNPKIKQLLPILLQVFGHQILIDGLFNADPHPGNLFLLDDGRLGLLDFGQVKSLSIPTRVGLAKLLLALAAHETSDIVQCMVDLGFATERMEEQTIEQYAILTFDRADKTFIGGVTEREFRATLRARDPMVSFPEELALVARVANLLRAAASLAGTQISLAQWWAPCAEQTLRKHKQCQLVEHIYEPLCGSIHESAGCASRPSSSGSIH